MSYTKRYLQIDGWRGPEVSRSAVGAGPVVARRPVPSVPMSEGAAPPTSRGLRRMLSGTVYPAVDRPAELTFGEMMKRLRIGRGWSEKECAGRARVAVQTIVRMEAQDAPERMQRMTLKMVGGNAFGYPGDQLSLMWRICRSDNAARRLLAGAAELFGAESLKAALRELRACGALR